MFLQQSDLLDESPAETGSGGGSRFPRLDVDQGGNLHAPQLHPPQMSPLSARSAALASPSSPSVTPRTPGTPGAGGGGGEMPRPTSAMDGNARRQNFLQLQRAQLEKRKSSALAGGVVRSTSKEDLKSPLSSTARPTTPASTTSTPQHQRRTDDAVGPFFPHNTGTNDDAFTASLRNVNTKAQEKPLSEVEKTMLSQGIQPIFDPGDNSNKEAKDVKLDLSDMRTFLNTPAPKGQTILCYIQRNKQGMSKMAPEYSLFLKDGPHLITAKKRSKKMTSNYIMSSDPKDFDKRSNSFLGKVRSNFLGTEFILYDRGVSPKQLSKKDGSQVNLNLRQELVATLYEANVFGSKGPRKMTALVPTLGARDVRTQWKPTKPEESIVAKFREGSLAGMRTLKNKPPKWNENVGAYVLNFNGRVTMASVKNFQLIEEDDPDRVVLQFGRTDKDKFTMDFAYPLTPLQAFSICVSSFDYKIACE